MALPILMKTASFVLSPFRRSMRYKLMIVMIVIAVMPLTLVTLFAMNTTRQSVSIEIVRSNESRMGLAAKYFDEKYDQLRAITYSILLDSNLFPNASGVISTNRAPQDTSDSYIKEKLRALYSANNSIISQITLYIKDKKQLFVVDKDAVRTTDQLRTPNIDWSGMNDLHESVNVIMNSNRNNFTIWRSMNRFENREVLGGIALDVRWNMMKSVLDMIHSEPDSHVMISDDKGNVLYNPFGNDKQAASIDAVVKNFSAAPADSGYIRLDDRYLFYQPVVSNHFWIVKEIPMSYVTSGAFSTLHFSLYTALIFIFLAIAVSILIAYFMTKPISKLIKSMKAVELSNFNVSVSEIRSDEIGTLERRFNSMLQRIKELIQIEFKSKIEKRSAQIKAMQAQINPHFLYNALQSIGGIALSRNVPEVYEHVRAISEMFRYTIKMKVDLVSIADEIDHVNNYLHIQKLRFQDMIHVRIEVDSDCREYRIPKFSLQPLVENCFVHGLEEKLGPWTITVNVQKVLDEIEINIEDNGVGIEEDKLQDLRNQLSHLSEDLLDMGDSMGMKSVDYRIKLTFGESYGLFLTSSKGKGTAVKLVIPAVPQEGEELSA